MVPKALDLGTTELNTTIHDISYVGLYIIFLPMFILHNIQHVGVREIKAWEHAACNQLKQLKRTVYLLQIQLEDKEKKTKKWHHDRKRLEKDISLDSQEVPEVGVTPNMIVEARVFKLG